MSLDGAREPRNWKVQKKDGSRLEPANLAVLRQWVASRQIGPNDLVINEELPDWIPAAEAIELFDLFEKLEPTIEPTKPAAKQQEILQVEVEIPDCAFHPGRPAAEICVGCGKFVCKECGERSEGRLYCRGCFAERQVSAEMGNAPGPAPMAQIIPGVRTAGRISRQSRASLIFAALALVASSLMFLPNYRMITAPVVGLVSFLAALLGAIGLGNIRSSQSSARSKQYALTGLLVGLCVLILSITAISSSIKEFASTSANRGNQRNQPETILPQTGRRQDSSSNPREREEREANAQQLLDQVANHLKEGQLEQAVSAARTLIGLYPDTQAGKRLEGRINVLEQALTAKQAEDQETLQQDEELARQRLEHAARVYTEGNHSTAIDLFKSILESYPDTESAARAKEELKKIESVDANLRMKKQDQEALQLVQQAKKHMEAGEYKEAADLYRRVVDQFPNTPTATSARADYQQAQLFLADPSEREFHEIATRLSAQTYETSIEQLQHFLLQHPHSARFEEVKKTLQENQAGKTMADGLYAFGKTYLDEKKYSLALGRYDKLIKEHPRSQWIPQARKDYDLVLEKLKE